MITNEKVAGFTPKWASFRGFSFLFDNLGKNLSPLNGKLQKIDCDCSNPNLELYRALEEALGEIEQLTNTYLFCPLPCYSYHVTVWDGLNEGNVKDVSRSYRFNAEDFLEGLPNSLLTSSMFTRSLSGDPLHISMRCIVKFEFEKLTKWGNNVLVARLKSADTTSASCLNHVESERRKILGSFQDQFGVKTSSSSYSPHVSLGYFANKELAELATPQIDRWTDRFKKKTAGKTIAFKNISLYGFTDMVTFFK